MFRRIELIYFNSYLVMFLVRNKEIGIGIKNKGNVKFFLKKKGKILISVKKFIFFLV